MIPLTLRQFRGQGLWGLGAVVVVGAVLAITGPHLVHVYNASRTACHSAGGFGPACSNPVTGTDRDLQIALMTLVLIAPALIGMFWGAPLIGRELETGTYRLAWTQSIPRMRWLTVKLTCVGAASAVAGAAIGLMGSWWASPIDAVSKNRFGPGMFALHGFVPGAYALFAFVLGATAGVLFRRTFPAMAVTLAGFIAARLLVTYELRPNLLPQTTKSFPLSPATFGIQINSPSVSIVPQPPDLPNAWVLSTSIVNAKGQSPTQSFINSACSGLPGVNGAPLPAPWGGHRTAVSASASARDALQHCMTSVAASYHVVVRYQAANHFWGMQCLESLVFVLAAVGLGALSFFWVRRHLN